MVWALSGLGFYYSARADTGRAIQVAELMRAALTPGRPWFHAVSDAQFGLGAYLCGQFDVARSHLELATANWRGN